jgi:hypothetical protein
MNFQCLSNNLKANITKIESLVKLPVSRRKNTADENKNLGNSGTPRVGGCHRTRNIVIAAVAVVLILSLLFAGLVFDWVLFISPNNDDMSQVTPTPTLTPTATAAPTQPPTATPTFTPLPTFDLRRNFTFSSICLDFNYQSTDQEYFGPAHQLLCYSRQPSGVLSVFERSPFNYSFCLSAGSKIMSDKIVSVTCTSSGFPLVSVDPATPITFTAGQSRTITVTILTPSSYDGALSYHGALIFAIKTSG